MNLICTRAFLSSLLFLIPEFCSGQFGNITEEQRFLDHLRINKLYQERNFVLDHIQKTSPGNSVFLEKAWTYRALQRYDSAIQYYQRVPFDTIYNYKFHVSYLSLLFKANRLETFKPILAQHPSLEADSSLQNLFLAVDLMENRFPREKKLASGLCAGLVKAHSNADRIKNKSGFLAGSYSMIPGLGKLYYGQKRQALNAFIASAALGLQTYESYRKSGPESPRFIIFGSLFSVFYLANIYGTVKGLKKVKRDHQLQLHYEIVSCYFDDDAVYPYAR